MPQNQAHFATCGCHKDTAGGIVEIFLCPFLSQIERFLQYGEGFGRPVEADVIVLAQYRPFPPKHVKGVGPANSFARENRFLTLLARLLDGLEGPFQIA